MVGRVLSVTGFVLLLGLGVGLVVYGVDDLNLQRRLRAGGETVRGTVVGFESPHVKKGRNNGVTYAFTARGGRELQGSDRVSRETRRQLREGGPVVVQYLVHDPTTNQVPEAQEEGYALVSVVVGTFVVIVGTLVVVFRLARVATKPVERPGRGKADAARPERAAAA